MKQHYAYDELYGVLLSKNENDTERIYFITECQFWKFYIWMYQYGWNLIGKNPCEKSGLKGFEITLHK